MALGFRVTGFRVVCCSFGFRSFMNLTEGDRTGFEVDCRLGWKDNVSFCSLASSGIGLELVLELLR